MVGVLSFVVFGTLSEVVSQYEFNKYVKRYNGNYHVRQLDCWNQFVQLFSVNLAACLQYAQ